MISILRTLYRQALSTNRALNREVPFYTPNNSYERNFPTEQRPIGTHQPARYHPRAAGQRHKAA